MRLDPDEPARFLLTGYERRDSVAIFLKSYQTGRVMQRILPLTHVIDPGFQAWLRILNDGSDRWNVYVSVNAVSPAQRARTREGIGRVRHIFLDVDAGADAVLDEITRRPDLPCPSYVMRSSPHRLQVLWRTAGMTKQDAEALQRQLARDLGADTAATSCSQTARLPGFYNHKYASPYPIGIQYTAMRAAYAGDQFPACRSAASPPSAEPAVLAVLACPDVVERARRYAAAIGPAIAGQHGDQRTFSVACRLVRGFALNDADALAVLIEWNARCQPPWTLRELEAKIAHARRYGQEGVGHLLDAHGDVARFHPAARIAGARAVSRAPSRIDPRHAIAAPLARHMAASVINGSVHQRRCPNMSDLADRRSFEVPENAMPRQQQKRTDEQSQPSQRSRVLPPSAVKFTKSPSDQGRLAFADVVINEDTFHLFKGLKICSFVLLRPREQGEPRRLYVPGHKLPSGQNFRHLQEDTGDLEPLRQAILAGYEAKFGSGATSDTRIAERAEFDEERMSEEEIPY
jgi:hypothetical protein